MEGSMEELQQLLWALTARFAQLPPSDWAAYATHREAADLRAAAGALVKKQCSSQIGRDDAASLEQ